MIQENLTHLFAKLVERTGGNSKAAEVLGCSRQKVSQYLGGNVKVTEDVVNKLGDPLGVFLQVHLQLTDVSDLKRVDYDKQDFVKVVFDLNEAVFKALVSFSDMDTYYKLDDEDYKYYHEIGKFMDFVQKYSLFPDPDAPERDELGNLKDY